MATDQIAFVSDLDHLDGYDVLRTYDLGPEGYAGVIKCGSDTELNRINYDTFENYSKDLKVELLWRQDKISADSNDWATISDVTELHNVSDDGHFGDDVTVAVMDSGIHKDHYLFDGQPVMRYDATGTGGLDNVGHGTACAGQIARLAPKADLIDVRIFGSEGSTGLETIVDAYSWLINNTDKYDIVNMSWGANSRIRRIEKLQQALISDGVRDVTSAGNSGGTSGSPATAPDAFSVGSCDKHGRMSDFSSYNPNNENPEVTAIGENIRLARAPGTSMGNVINNKFVVASGTSFSAPNTAGMVARYLSANRGSTPEEIKRAFVETADDLENIERDGAGLVNYDGAMDGEVSETAQATVWSFAGRDCMYVGADWLDSGKYTVDRQKLLDALEKD